MSASLSELEVEDLLAAAEAAAEQATVDAAAFVGCEPVDRACVATWATPFLERAWRRPVEPVEVDDLLELYDLGETPAAGVRLAVTGALVAGSFLYRPEIGGPVVADRVQLDGWQIASRLSYLLWRTMPDDVLFDAARAGRISTAEEVEAEAIRMLADARGSRALASFHVDWLGLGNLPLLDRVPSPPPPAPFELVDLLDAPLSGWSTTDDAGVLLPADTFTETWDGSSPAITTGSSDTDRFAHHGVALGETFKVRGRMRADDDAGGIGVTVYSVLPATNAWYRLQRLPGAPFSLASSGTVEAGGADTCSDEGTFVMPAGTWVEFEVSVVKTPVSVAIEARLWPEGGVPPVQPLLACTDVAFTRLGSGTVGVWAAGPGDKVWADLHVQTTPPVEPFSFAPVAAAYVDGARSFLETWATEGARLDELLLADWAMANEMLAPALGVTGITGEDFQRVTLPPERVGLLTQPLFLATFAKPDQSSPVLRGKVVREALLCDVLPPPPPGVVILAPDPDPSATTRERFAEHVADPACAGCHALMDPLGFGFEQFDQLGIYREEENGLPVDASGDIVAAGDADGSFADVRGLVELLAGSDEVRACVVTHWYRFASAHLEDPALPDPALAAALAACTDETCRVEDIVRAIVTADSFRFRAGHEGDLP